MRNCLIQMEKQYNKIALERIRSEERTVEEYENLPPKMELIKKIVAFANSGGGFILIYTHYMRRGYLDRIEKRIDNARSVTIGLELKIHILEELKIHISEKGSKIIVIEVISKAITAYYRTSENSRYRLYCFLNYDKTVETIATNQEYLYRYINLESFITNMREKCWRFSEPSIWEDEYEKRFYCADYTSVQTGDAPRKVFASCTTQKKDSHAQWIVYKGNGGLKQRIIELKLDFVKLSKQLNSFAQQKGYLFEERFVDYMSKNDIDSIHKKSNGYYNKYFSPFSLKNYLSLLSLKRDAYDYEKEWRLFMVPDPAVIDRAMKTNDADSINISIDWSEIIEGIRIDKNCSDDEAFIFEEICRRRGIYAYNKNQGNNNRNNNLNSIPDDNNNLKQIGYEKFNINAMKGGMIKIE